MARASIFLILLLGAFLAMPLVSAYGYGTSSISLSKSSVNVLPGSSATINYTVNLATGNTWGTNLAVNDQTLLSNKSITISLSDSSGDPPFSGKMTVTVSPSTASGTYGIVLSATGDDPSTSNATLMLNVSGPHISGNGTAAPVTNNTNGVGIAGNIQRAAVNNSNASSNSSASSKSGSYYATNNSPSAWSNGPIVPGVLIIIMLLISIYLVSIMKSMSTRLVILGVLLILAGTAVWLYGDYGGGPQYVWPGVIAILLGTLIWVYGDYIAGAFKMKGK